MNDKDITILLKKAEELKALFVLGQRVIPFLEEIFVFVNEIKPLLDEINISIEDNLKRMPNASKQLSKVTEATELATTEIMDIVDGIVYKSDIITSNIEVIKETQDKKIQAHEELLRIIIQAVEDGSDLKAVLPELKSGFNALATKSDATRDTASKEIDNLITSISNDSSAIMMSLQVQDITTQQIAAVNNLLQTVQKKLYGILEKFNKSEISEIIAGETSNEGINVSQLHREIAFDPDAVESITEKGTRQYRVDEIFSKHANGDDLEDAGDDSPTSQEDIDALFRPPVADINDISETSAETTSSEGETTPNESQSQDEIDAMFNKPDDDTDESVESTASDIDSNNSKDAGDDDSIPDEPFSQDDIDAMFGK